MSILNELKSLTKEKEIAKQSIDSYKHKIINEMKEIEDESEFFEVKIVKKSLLKRIFSIVK